MASLPLADLNHNNNSERREQMAYKVTVFDNDNFDRIALQAWVDSPLDRITVHDNAVVVHDVDDEFMIVPLENVGYISVVKDDEDYDVDPHL